MKTRLFFIFVILAGWVMPLGAADVITIGGRETSADHYQKKSFFSGRAKERFVHVERDKTYSLPRAALAADHTDTITIIAFRMGFLPESPDDDPLTTGQGTFDYRDSAAFVEAERHWLDPAPHNKHYFESHLRSLSHYWEVVSGGRLYLEYEVWPAGGDEDTNYYQLDRPMVYYGAQIPNFGLGEFFHDALNAAYQIDGGSFSFRDARGNKKAVIIFHAGADQQTNLSFTDTDTPYDLYTGFVTFEISEAVILGADTVVEGTIMPETMAQDGRVTVMNAVLAHEFGHQLGLVDLYNTGSVPFLSQLGDFALMDNNGMNTAAYIDEFGLGAFGTVPVFPCAWSRAYLGFDEVVEFREGTAIELAAVKMETDRIKIAKIPISATEYFLLENRRGDVDGNLDVLRVDSVSNVVLWPAKLQFIIVGDRIDTLKIPVPEYDVFLPENAAGIAIWHVDEAVAATDYFPFDVFTNNFDANTLQWDPNRRFISMVEADGIIDFGGNYARGYGRASDLFYAGNNASFGTYTNPASIAHGGGYTHVNVTNVSAPDMIMSFDLGRGNVADGFPRRVSTPAGNRYSPVAADLDDDGEPEILTVAENKIMAVTADGRDFLDPDDSWADYDTLFSPIDAHTDINVFRPIDTTLVSLPVFAEILIGEAATEPVAARFADSAAVMVGTSTGMIYLYRPYPSGLIPPDLYRARLQTLFGLAGNVPVTRIVPDEQNGLVYALYTDGALLVAPWDSTKAYSRTWNPLSDPGYALHEFDAPASGICRYGDGLIVVTETEDQTTLYQTRFGPISSLSTVFVEDSLVLNEIGFRGPVATDFDRDGSDEVVLLSSSGQIHTFRLGPTDIEDYAPLTISTGDTAAAGPAVADINGDGFPELLVPGTNRLYGYDRNGCRVTDFPHDLDFGRPGQVVVAGPIVADINGDARLDLAAVTFDSIPRSRTVTILYLEFPDSLNYPDSIIVRDSLVEYAYYNYFSNLYVVTPGMGTLAGFPVPAGILGFPRLGDTVIGAGVPLYMKNGVDGLLAFRGADGWLSAWRCGWSGGTGSWSMSGRTPDGGAYLPLDSLGEEKAAIAFVPDGEFFAYPNPATGGRTTIRFYVNQPATVSIAIFDALGDRVREFAPREVEGNSHGEIVWELSGTASGVYHCRLDAQARDGSASGVLFTKIAVVK